MPKIYTKSAAHAQKRAQILTALQDDDTIVPPVNNYASAQTKIVANPAGARAHANYLDTQLERFMLTYVRYFYMRTCAQTAGARAHIHHNLLALSTQFDALLAHIHEVTAKPITPPELAHEMIAQLPAQILDLWRVDAQNLDKTMHLT